MLEIYRILKFVVFLPSVAAIKPEEKNSNIYKNKIKQWSS
jgi:hypothetical protein